MGEARRPPRERSAAATRAIFRRLVEDVFNRGNPAALDDLLAAGFVDHGAGRGPTRDRAANLRGVVGFLAAFPDLRQEIDALVVEGDLVVARSTFRATHLGPWRGVAPTGRSVTWTGMTMMRTAGGRFVERWSLSDDEGLLEQIGAVPSLSEPRSGSLFEDEGNRAGIEGDGP